MNPYQRIRFHLAHLAQVNAEIKALELQASMLRAKARKHRGKIWRAERDAGMETSVLDDVNPVA